MKISIFVITLTAVSLFGSLIAGHAALADGKEMFSASKSEYLKDLATESSDYGNGKSNLYKTLYLLSNSNNSCLDSESVLIPVTERNEETESSMTPEDESSEELLFEDNFDDVNSGWPRTSLEAYAFNYEEDEYYIQVNNRDWAAWVWNTKAGQLWDFAVEIDTKPVSGQNPGTYGGLVFRLKDNDNFYAFEKSGDVRYRLRKRSNGVFQDIQYWTWAGTNKSNDEFNHLMVTCQGIQIDLYANGHHLASITDASYDKGYVGMIVDTVEPNKRYHFDNIKIYEVHNLPSETYYLPTVTDMRRTPTRIALSITIPLGMWMAIFIARKRGRLKPMPWWLILWVSSFSVLFIVFVLTGPQANKVSTSTGTAVGVAFIITWVTFIIKNWRRKKVKSVIQQKISDRTSEEKITYTEKASDGYSGLRDVDVTYTKVIVNHKGNIPCVIELPLNYSPKRWLGWGIFFISMGGLTLGLGAYYSGMFFFYLPYALMLTIPGIYFTVRSRWPSKRFVSLSGIRFIDKDVFNSWRDEANPEQFIRRIPYRVKIDNLMAYTDIPSEKAVTFKEWAKRIFDIENPSVLESSKGNRPFIRIETDQIFWIRKSSKQEEIEKVREVLELIAENIEKEQW